MLITVRWQNPFSMSPGPADGSDSQTEEHGQVESPPPADTGKEGTQGSLSSVRDLGQIELIGEKELDFLRKKGAVQILPLLADGPKQFSEINNAVTVSKGTVSTRLTEGAKIGLWKEEFRYPNDGGKIKQYKIQPRLHFLAELAKRKNIGQLTEERRKARQQYDAAVDSFLDEFRDQ